MYTLLTSNASFFGTEWFRRKAGLGVQSGSTFLIWYWSYVEAGEKDGQEAAGSCVDRTD